MICNAPLVLIIVAWPPNVWLYFDFPTPIFVFRVFRGGDPHSHYFLVVLDGRDPFDAGGCHNHVVDGHGGGDGEVLS